MPYWDWTKPRPVVPDLAADISYEDPHTGAHVHNPFYDAEIAFKGVRTSRQVGLLSKVVDTEGVGWRVNE